MMTGDAYKESLKDGRPISTAIRSSIRRTIRC
jgi:hypothetical protein